MLQPSQLDQNGHLARPVPESIHFCADLGTKNHANRIVTARACEYRRHQDGVDPPAVSSLGDLIFP